MDSTIYSPEEDSYLLSEILRKEIPKLLEEKPNLTFLEIGSGSGIQLETVLKLGIKKENIFSVDINPKAVEYCKSKGFNCKISNLFEKIKRKYDIIVFNPPYLPQDPKEPMDSQMATTGGKEGSEVINEFLKQSKKYLNEKGKIYLLTSILTKGVNFQDYYRVLLGEKKIFYETLYVWKLSQTI